MQCSIQLVKQFKISSKQNIDQETLNIQNGMVNWEIIINNVDKEGRQIIYTKKLFSINTLPCSKTAS